MSSVDLEARSGSPRGGPLHVEGATEFDKRERQRLERRIEAYDAIAEWRHKRVVEHHYYSEQVRRLVTTLVLPGSRILEVGCGLGDLLAALDGPKRVGIDLSPKMIDLARQRHPELDLRVADVERGD